MPEFSEIISRCQNGDLTAFRIIIETHQSYAYSLALRMLCDVDDARDVVQESFIKVWQNMGTFDPNRKFATWLYKIITNICLDYLKARRRKRRIFSSMDIDNKHFASEADADADMMNKELIREIALLAEGLTAKQRMVFVLRDLQDLKMEEIVEITGLNKNKVKSNLYYARKNIRAKLEAWELER